MPLSSLGASVPGPVADTTGLWFFEGGPSERAAMLGPQERIDIHRVRWELVKGCALELLRRWPWQGGELVYLDPPYHEATRSRPGRAYYRCEFMSNAEHRELLALARTLPCMVAISGYAHPLYAESLADWRLVTFPAEKRALLAALQDQLPEATVIRAGRRPRPGGAGQLTLW